MRFFTTIILLLLSNLTLSQTQGEIDPDTVDPEMMNVMYLISKDDIRITSYRSGHPSEFELKLCARCQRKKYQLASEAELLINGNPLVLKDLTLNLPQTQLCV